MRIFYDGINYRLQKRAYLWFIPLWWVTVSQYYASVENLRSDEWLASEGRDEFDAIPIHRDVRVRIVSSTDDTFRVQELKRLGGWETVGRNLTIPGEHEYTTWEPLKFDTQDSAYTWATANL